MTIANHRSLPVLALLLFFGLNNCAADGGRSGGLPARAVESNPMVCRMWATPIRCPADPIGVMTCPDGMFLARADLRVEALPEDYFSGGFKVISSLDEEPDCPDGSRPKSDHSKPYPVKRERGRLVRGPPLD